MHYIVQVFLIVSHTILVISLVNRRKGNGGNHKTRREICWYFDVLGYKYIFIFCIFFFGP